jgi:hypothetical protein
MDLTQIVPPAPSVTWPQVVMTLVLVLPGIIAGVTAAVIGYLNKQQLNQQDKSLEQIHQSVNGGRLAAENAAKEAATAAYLAGVAAGQKGEQARVAEILSKSDAATQRLQEIRGDQK